MKPIFNGRDYRREVMLKTIKDILRTMGEALSFANAGEMLSDNQKAEVLSRCKDPYPVSLNVAPSRVILVSDEDFTLEGVERAISQCHEKTQCWICFACHRKLVKIPSL